MELRFEKIRKAENSSFLYSVFESIHFPFHWHYHKEYELVLMYNCTGKRVVGDHIGGFNDADLVLIGPGLPHSFSTEPLSGDGKNSHKSIVLHFTLEFLGKHSFNPPELNNIRSLFNLCLRGILFSGETKKRVIDNILALPNYSGLQELFEFLTILDILSNSEEKTLLASKGYVLTNEKAFSSEMEFETKIEKVFHYIQQNFTSDIKLEDAASFLNMSVPNFCSFFKKTTLTTFNAYVNSIRIGTACKSLIETDLSISEICYESGFNSLSNFNRKFLAMKEISPREFRKRFRNKRNY